MGVFSRDASNFTIVAILLPPVFRARGVEFSAYWQIPVGVNRRDTAAVATHRE